MAGPSSSVGGPTSASYLASATRTVRTCLLTCRLATRTAPFVRIVRTTGFVAFPVRITSVIRTFAVLAAPFTRTTRYRLPPLKTSRADVSLRAAAFAAGFAAGAAAAGTGLPARLTTVAVEPASDGRGVRAAAAAGSPGLGGIGRARVGRGDARCAVRRERHAVTGEPDAADALDAEAAVAGADVLGIHVDETRQRALELDARLTQSVRLIRISSAVCDTTV